jgi:hypothetical protein
MTIAKENLPFLKIETRINGSADFCSRRCCQKMNDTRNTAETTSIAITNGTFQPCETPSDRPMRSKSRPEVNRNAPIQSTLDARGQSAEFSDLGGSFGITKTAAALTMNDAPAITKKTTFQFVYSEMIPPLRDCQASGTRWRIASCKGGLTSKLPNTCPVGAPPE